MSPETTAVPAPAPRVIILASGSGTLFQSIVEAGVEVTALITDRPCVAAERAERAGIPVHELTYTRGRTDREAWNAQLSATLQELRPDLVVSAGFMRIIAGHVLREVGVPFLNTHPALLPAFPGAHAVADALHYGVKVTGTTVHLIDDGVDTGPIVAQEAVPVFPDDTEDTLHERIKVVERRLIVDVLRSLRHTRLITNGRKAWISDHD